MNEKTGCRYRPTNAQEKNMTLNDLRAKRNVLEFKLGGLIKQFEDETGLEVDAKIHYERCWSDWEIDFKMGESATDEHGVVSVSFEAQIFKNGEPKDKSEWDDELAEIARDQTAKIINIGK